MIDEQIKAIRDLMLQIIFSRTENYIAQYLAECIVNQYILINKNNDAYGEAIDVEAAAWMELPKYLDAGLKGGDIWAHSLTTQQKVAFGKDYYDVLEAYDELSKIRINLCKH